MNNRYFVLDSKKCRIVPGAKRAALYNFTNGGVDPIIDFDQSKFNKDCQYFHPVESGSRFADLFEDLLGRKLGKYSDTAPKSKVKFERGSNYQFVWLELTSDCNLRCVHCYGSCKPKKINQAPMSTDHWIDAMKQVKNMKINSIQFVGGEPLLHPGFEDLLLFASTLKFKAIEVFTNGLLVNERILNEVLMAGATLATTLYSHIPQVHDKVTGCKGSFDQTISFIEKAVEWGIRIRLGCVVSEVNLGQYGGLRELASKIGAVYTGEDPVRPVGRGEIPGCRTTIKRSPVRPPFSTSRAMFEINNKFNPCWMGKAAIIENGDVLPCVFAREWVAGNVIKTPFAQIMENGMKKYWLFSKDQISTCKDCEFRYACHDCRPMAAGFANGDIDAKTAACGYDPYSGKWK